MTLSGTSANDVGLEHLNYTETWFSQSALRGPVHNHVHTTPKEFENRTSFLRGGLLSTLIRHGNGALLTRSSNPPTLLSAK